MRISIPSIPQFAGKEARQHAAHTLATATTLLCDVLQRYRGRTVVMTGAGVSVDSGIAPYRGENGHYTVHKGYRPVFYHEFAELANHSARRRYWSRSFLGYPPVLIAQPNKTHYSIAALQRLGYFDNIITQNVDSLHHRATPSASHAAQTILELHGTLQNVVCVKSLDGKGQDVTSAPRDRTLYERLSYSHMADGSPRKPPPHVPHNSPAGRTAYPLGCGFRGSRTMYQAELADRNAAWDRLARDMQQSGTSPKTNPDGDVQLPDQTDYSSFEYAPCPQCGGLLKPSVIFFGESVPDAMRDRSFDLVRNNDALILVGTSLATYSAFRLVKMAQERGMRTVLINRGPTRADDIVDDKIDIGSSDIFHAVAMQLAQTRAERDPILQRLLSSGNTVTLDSKRGVVSS